MEDGQLPSLGGYVRWTPRIGGIAVAAVVLTTLIAPPAFAEAPTPTAPPVQRAMDSADSPCWNIEFPLASPSGREPIRVTLPGDDVAEAGTLRWALEQANADPELDEIVIDSGLTIETAGDIPVEAALILRGDGAGTAPTIIANDDSDSILTEDGRDEFPVQISDLTLLGGATEWGIGLEFRSTVCSLALHRVTMSGFNRMAVQVGDTWPFASLDIDGSTFTDNGTPGEPSYDEGAVTISNEGVSGSYRIRNSTFADNHMAGFAINAGLESGWDGMHGNITIENTSFVRNVAGDESVGGVWLSDFNFDDRDEESPSLDRTAPMLTVRNSEFRDNSGGAAGGIYLDTVILATTDEADQPRFVAIEGTTFENNTLAGEPNRWAKPARDIVIGDAENDGLANTELLTVTNSTFIGDPEIPSIQLANAIGATTLEHVTMVDSSLAVDAHEGAASVNFDRSVFDARSGAPVYVGPLPGPGPDLVVTEQYSAYTAEPDSMSVPAGPGRVIATSADLALGDLVESTGPTPVFVPAATSPLVDALESPGAAVDQRGVERPQGAAADIGAVELQSSPSVIEVAADQRADAGKPLTFMVSRTNSDAENPWTGEVTVRVSAIDGTAIAGTDFTAPVDQTLTWAAGDTDPKPVTVATGPAREGAGEVAMQLEVLEPSAHAILGERAAAAGTIVHPKKTDPVKPDPDPDPDPKPKPDPDPKPDPKPGPDPKPQPKPEPKPQPGADGLANTGGGDSTLGLLLAGGLFLAAGGTLALRRVRSRSGA